MKLLLCRQGRQGQAGAGRVRQVMSGAVYALLFPDELCPQLALSRAVKFAEIDDLPRAEHDFAVFHNHHLRGAEERGLDVGVAVAFRMAVIPAQRNQFGHVHSDVAFDIGVCPFVDGCY